MDGFWEALLAHSVQLFGGGGLVAVAAAFLIYTRDRGGGSKPAQPSITTGNTGGDVVGGNKVTGIGPLSLALILGALVCVVGLALMFAGGGDRATAIGGSAIVGDGNKIGQ